MTTTDLLNRIQRAQASLERDLQKEAEKAGADLVALIANRVIQSGRDNEGQQFSPYSENQVAAFRFLGKSRTAGAERRVREKAKRRESISYKDFRALNNLNTSPKNFEFTGEMWRKFSVLDIAQTATGVVVTIGGQTGASAEKIAQNSAREKRSIIKPSKLEIETVKTNLQAWVQKLLNRG